MSEFAKMKKQELIDELNDSKTELKKLWADASDLESNINDAKENIDRIINMIENNEFDVEEDEKDENKDE